MTELTDKGRELRNAYQRERYKKNRQKELDRQAEYWNKKAAQQEQEREKDHEQET